MSIYSISDLHLSLYRNKTMDIFGGKWINHVDKIEDNWQKLVDENDIVIIAGDISWALNLAEAESDLRFIDDLKGKKVLLRGNHDYWWPSNKKFLEFLEIKNFRSISFLNNNFIELDKFLLCGSRGWEIPSKDSKLNDLKIFKREVKRIENSITLARNNNKYKEIILILHFPPFGKDNLENDCTEIIEKYLIKKVIFGHIHGDNIDEYRNISYNKFKFYLTSADAVEFVPLKIV